MVGEKKDKIAFRLGKEKIPTKVLANEGRFMLYKSKEFRFCFFDQNIEKEKGLITQFCVSEQQGRMKSKL